MRRFSPLALRSAHILYISKLSKISGLHAFKLLGPALLALPAPPVSEKEIRGSSEELAAGEAS